MTQITDIELRAVERARSALYAKGINGPIFAGPMIRTGDLAVVRAVIDALRDLTPAMRQAAGQGAFEDQWKRVLDVASPREEG